MKIIIKIIKKTCLKMDKNKYYFIAKSPSEEYQLFHVFSLTGYSKCCEPNRSEPAVQDHKNLVKSWHCMPGKCKFQKWWV